jgi:hypothetical protein
MHRTGITSFVDMRTVDDVEFPTFKATCIALNLIENDAMWITTMKEACERNSSSSCRGLFVFYV